MATAKAPIVLVHGLWMTPASWDTWAEHFRAKGHEVVVPGWPGIDDHSVADVRANPEALKNVGITQIVDHYESVIRALPGFAAGQKPIIMGHSFGGLFTQMLADRDLGSAYVGVTPAQPAGVTTLPGSTLRIGLPVLGNPFRKRSVTPITAAQFHYAFGNDLSRAESDVIWQGSAVPSFNRVFFEGVAAAFNEKGGLSHVNYAKPDRAALLLIAGGIDHVIPPKLVNAIAAKYNGPSVVETKLFPGRTHRIVSQDGWQEVADFALDWAVKHSK